MNFFAKLKAALFCRRNASSTTARGQCPEQAQADFDAGLHKAFTPSSSSSSSYDSGSSSCDSSSSSSDSGSY